MANRKRPLVEDSPPGETFKTPEKRVSEVRRQQDADYMQWGVERTCQFLRTEGLQKWEDAFRGWFFFLAGKPSVACPKFSGSLDRRRLLITANPALLLVVSTSRISVSQLMPVLPIPIPV